MKARLFANLRHSLEDNPEATSNITTRSNVTIAINAAVEGWNTAQAASSG